MYNGLELKLKRIEKEFKQYEFARELGVTPQYLRLIEKGKIDIRISLAKKICNLLECTVDELFF